MPNVGPWEIILLLLLALLLFGAKRLPEIGRSMGKGMREFKDSVSGKDSDDEPAELPMQTTDATIAARDRERERDPVSNAMKRLPRRLRHAEAPLAVPIIQDARVSRASVCVADRCARSFLAIPPEL
jgi:sec-independent protein translocase protein TatA